MPEGPEIRKAADKIEKALLSAPVESVYFAFPELKKFERSLNNRNVTSVETRGKALLIHFDNDLSIYSHNQLYGRWYIRAAQSYPRTSRQLRLAIHTPNKSALLYSASDIHVLTPEQVTIHPFLSRLGPDILDCKPETVLSQLQDKKFRRRQLVSLFLDQHFLAGVGNYLRSEILYSAGLNPRLRPVDCTGEQLLQLADAAVFTARQAYRHNGITNNLELVKQLKAEGWSRGEYRHHVFSRAGQPCFSCETTVQKAMAGSRRYYFCAGCQQ
ncbi:MAG: endonuclease VIII [Gammaproteobacteria bacterium]